MATKKTIITPKTPKTKAPKTPKAPKASADPKPTSTMAVRAL